MNTSQQLRNDIGKALYEASIDSTDSRNPQWDAILNKEEWIYKALRVIDVYAAFIVSTNKAANFYPGDK